MTLTRNQAEGLKEKHDWIRAVVDERDGEGCREWPWERTVKGYGRVLWEGRRGQVGHVVLELSGSPRPTGPRSNQLHSCDNPPCAAPWHLRWGSTIENRHECVVRLRQDSKLTAEQAIYIYNSNESARALAERFGVAHCTICRVRTGKSWSLITGHLSGETA